MRVAFFVSHFPCITETFVLGQITGLLDRGCDVQIFSDLKPDPTIEYHPDIAKYNLLARTHYVPLPQYAAYRPFSAARMLTRAIQAGRPMPFSILNPFTFGQRAASLRLVHDASSFIDGKPFDILHGHFARNGMRASALRHCGVLSGKLVVSLYGYDSSAAEHARRPRDYRTLYKDASTFLAVSDEMRARLNMLGCPREKLHVQRLCVDKTIAQIAVTRSVSRGPLHVLSIARLVPKKGLEWGITSVSELVRAGYQVDYQIAGDGPLKKTLQRHITALGVEGNAHLVGWKSRQDILNLLGHADVLIAPSTTANNGDLEGTPVAVLEAQAAGLPVVATRHAGIPELIKDGCEGFLVPEEDSETLTSRLRLLADDVERRAEMGRAGRRAIAARHDNANLTEQLCAIYSDLLSTASR